VRVLRRSAEACAIVSRLAHTMNDTVVTADDFQARRAAKAAEAEVVALQRSIIARLEEQLAAEQKLLDEILDEERMPSDV
jgi:hypothetical protein